MRRVLVAVDESDAAKRVATFVNGFFADSTVEVLGINVARGPVVWIPPATEFGGLYPFPLGVATPDTVVTAGGGPYLDESDEQRQERERAEQVATQTVEDSTLDTAETLVEFGDPAEAIKRAASEHQVDLIVVGNSDRGLLQRLLSPSVVQELVKHADRPVLVVP